jgi:hypothetical protein
MSFESLAVPGLIFFFLLAFYYYFSEKWIALMGLLFISFGLNSFTALAGTLWFPYKVVMFPIVIFALSYAYSSNYSNGVIKNYYLILALSVAVAWITQPNIPGLTFLQGPTMRPIVQLYTYASMGMMIPFLVSIVNTTQRLHQSLTLYLRLSEIVISIGAIHLVFIILGIDFIPILRPGGTSNNIAAFGMEGTVINRIYGFSGEPKSLATFALPYIFISLYNYIEKNFNISRLYHISFLILSTIVMIYTFSSAILMSAAFGIVIIPFLFKHRIQSRVISFISIIILGIIILGEVSNLFIKSPASNSNEKQLAWSDILYERSFGRVEDEVDERYESLALNYIFKKDPLFLLTGYGLGMYNYHLPLPKHGRGVEPIDSGWVVILLDLGLIGLMFFFLLFRELITIKNINATYNNIYLNSYIIGSITGFLAHIGNNALYQIFLFYGLTLAAYNIMTREAIAENNESID